MKILITGAKGFVGKNLSAELQNIQNGNNKTRPNIKIDEIYLYDIDSPKEVLEEACMSADFVFNLAGVNRPQNSEEFMQGNFGFASELLDTLKKFNNKCPVMLSSSIQATLEGRYDSDYGRSKKQGKTCFLHTAKKRVQRYLFTDFRTFSESGADLIIIRQWQLFVIILQMICR